MAPIGLIFKCEKINPPNLTKILEAKPDIDTKFLHTPKTDEFNISRILDVNFTKPNSKHKATFGQRLRDLFETMTSEELSLEKIKKRYFSAAQFPYDKSLDIFPDTRTSYIPNKTRFRSTKKPWETLSDVELAQIIEFKKRGLYKAPKELSEAEIIYRLIKH